MLEDVIAYLRVSSEEQADSRAGLDAQRITVFRESDRRGWNVVQVIEDCGYSGKDLRRPGIQAALANLRARKADALVVAKLDRLSRSLLDFAGLMDRARRERWALVALDFGVDMTTPAGEAMANVLATFAQFERRLIGQKTKEALAAKKARGVRLGRPSGVPDSIAERVRTLRSGPMSLRAIAETLNAEHVPTGHGGRLWYASTVRHLVDRPSHQE